MNSPTFTPLQVCNPSPPSFVCFSKPPLQIQQQIQNLKKMKNKPPLAGKADITGQEDVDNPADKAGPALWVKLDLWSTNVHCVSVVGQIDSFQTSRSSGGFSIYCVQMCSICTAKSNLFKLSQLQLNLKPFPIFKCNTLTSLNLTPPSIYFSSLFRQDLSIFLSESVRNFC